MHRTTDSFSESEGCDGPGPASKRLRIGLSVACALILLLVVGWVAISGKRYVVELDQAEIQEKLDVRFPIEKSYLLILTLTFSEPEVSLVEGSDRITFGVLTTLNVRIQGEQKSLGGRATVSTGLRYNQEDYSFYLADPRLESLEIQGIPIKYIDRVNDLAAKALTERLNRTPVHTLNRDDLKQSAARLILQDLEVKDGKLAITLGL